MFTNTRGSQIVFPITSPQVIPFSGRIERTDAIMQVGPSAIPHLVRWARYEQPRWKTNLLALFNKVLKTSLQDRSDTLAHSATSALILLGPKAEEAVPGLAIIMNDQRRPSAARRAGTALSVLGRKLLAADMALMTNRFDDLRREGVVNAGTYFGDRLAPAVPAIIQCLRDTNYLVAVDAARVLSTARAEPKLVVPALMKHFNDERVGVRVSAIQGIWEFGAQARPAVPALVALLKDPDRRISNLAADALKIIDPEALQEVRIK
jgi:HEAT repeat protein